jgi:hypothetical protein
VVPGVGQAWLVLNALPPGTTPDTLDPGQAEAWSEVRDWLTLQGPRIRIAVTGPGFAALLRGYAPDRPGLSVVEFAGDRTH